jgi:hypothetical protein
MSPVSEPIRVSPNGRYFVCSSGDPFFWLGDTQWELCCRCPPEDVPAVLEDRSARGFSVLQVMLTGVGDGTKPNAVGQTPWVHGNPDTPNERYFERVDCVLELARDSGLVVALGVYHQLHESRLTAANARTYAQWVASRYREMPHLVWSMYPRAEPAFVPVVRELAAGLQEGDGGRHLISVHPDPSPASSSFLPLSEVEGWLAFHSIQTWADTHLIVPMVTHDYRLKPAKPVVMAEGAYEAGEEYGFEVSPLWVRRQAYWTVLAGGHHSYGHNDLWRLPFHWRGALDAPGAAQLTILREVLTARRKWWSLVPDQSLIAGAAHTGTRDGNRALAARSGAGEWALVYLGGGGVVSVDLSKVGSVGGLEASWIDPATGEVLVIGTLANTGVEEFPAPAGWEDALLLLEAR